MLLGNRQLIVLKREDVAFDRDPQRAQQAMSQLTSQERRALLEMQEQQGVVSPEATNREMRRRLERAQKQAKRGR